MSKTEKNQTIFLKKKPRIISGYSIVGPKEGKGPFGKMFDYVMHDDFFCEKTHEKAERKMLEKAISGAAAKLKMKPKDLDMLISGDLLNQIITSSYAARSFDISFLGLFAACSAMSLSLGVGSCLVNAGYFKNIACATSSHFSTAERQFRFPLELGNQRPPTSQWTCTAAGCSVLSLEGEGPYIESVTFGKVMDYGIADVNNMGAAMAPAAMQTMLTVFHDTKTGPDDYDLIVTGDLGKLGSEILVDLMEKEGYKLGVNYSDCGQMMFYYDQKVLMGGSGCGCSASIFNSYILNKLNNKEFKKVLFISTGALLSTTSTQQGDTIPGIAHAVVIRSDIIKEGKKIMDMFLTYLYVFLVGGFICMIGQILVIKTTMTTARILVTFVFLGVILQATTLYQYIYSVAKAGISVPIVGFGASLAKGAMEAVDKRGIIGIFTGGLEATAGGIAAAVTFAFIFALIFKAKTKKSA